MSSIIQLLGSTSVGVLRADFSSLPTGEHGEVFVGKHLDTFEVEVTPGLLREYAARTGGEGATEVPATLLFAHAHREIASWYLPMLIGNLHLRQEWQFFQAARIGDVLRATRTIVDRYRWGKKGQREVIVCETNITNSHVTGALVARCRTHQSFVVPIEDNNRESAPRAKNDTRRYARAESSGTIAVSADPAHVLYGEPVLIDQTLCDLYVGMDADGNQLQTYHNNERSARALGFGGVVVQGTLGVCILSRALEFAFNTGYTANGRLDVEFRRIVKLGDTLTAGYCVTNWVPEGGRWRGACDVFVQNQHGEKVIRGSASVVAAAPGQPSKM